MASKSNEPQKRSPQQGTRTSRVQGQSPKVWPAHLRVDAPTLNEADEVTLRTFAIQSINELLRAYRDTQNGLYFWRAWLLTRSSGIAVSEPMLKKVDTIARKLCDAADRDEVASATEITKGAARADEYLRSRSLMTEIWLLANQAAGTTPDAQTKPKVPNAVMRQVADRHGISFNNLKQQWSRWWSESTVPDRETAFAQIADAWKPTR